MSQASTSVRDTGPSEKPVVERLRQDILTSVFAPGDRLVELQLSDRYSCGRAAIRSALVALEAEGLVAREANRGAVVRRVSVAEAIEITEARMVLESLIAAKAAGNVTDEDAEELLAIIARMRHSVEHDDAARYGALNRELHGKIHGIAGHAVARDLVDNLRNRGVHHQFRLALMPGRQEESFEQHEAIVEAIVAGDPDAATEAMRAHLASVVEVLERWSRVS